MAIRPVMLASIRLFTLLRTATANFLSYISLQADFRGVDVHVSPPKSLLPPPPSLHSTMIIDLPPVLGYDAISEILSEDLFLPALDDDEEYDMDGVAHKRNGVIGMRGNLGVNMGRTECSRVDESGKVNAMDSGMLSDAELVYSSTSASESELESYIDSGLESDVADLFSAPAPEVSVYTKTIHFLVTESACTYDTVADSFACGDEL